MEFRDVVNGINKNITIDPSNGIQRNYLPGDCLVPAGKISMFSVETPPTGWLECNGSTFDANIYVDLSNAIGTMWSDDNTYKVPDLRGLFLKGWDGTGTMGTYEEDENFEHDHPTINHEHTHTALSNFDGAHEHGLNQAVFNTTHGRGGAYNTISRGGTNQYWVWSDRFWFKTPTNRSFVNYRVTDCPVGHGIRLCRITLVIEI